MNFVGEGGRLEKDRPAVCPLPFPLGGRFNYNNHNVTVPGILPRAQRLVSRKRLIVFLNRGYYFAQLPDAIL